MSTNITGRDSYIIAQALYVAATALRSQERPEWSNADDMEAISEALFPGDFDWWHAKYRMEEGLRMGLKLPASGLMMDRESVEAWISAGNRDRDRCQDAAEDGEFDRNMAEMERDYQETIREGAVPRESFSEFRTPRGTRVMIALPDTMAFAVVEGWTEPDRASVTAFFPEEPAGLTMYVGAERMLTTVGPEWFEIMRRDGWRQCLQGQAFLRFLESSFPGVMESIEPADANLF